MELKGINKVQLEDGSILKLNLSPKFDVSKTKIGLTFTKDLTEDNVEIIVKVNGEVATFVSGINDSNFSCEASATKRF